MKRLFPLLILFLFFLSAGSARAGQERKVVLAAQNLCPLGCWDDAGEFKGTFVDAVREIFELMEMELEIQVLPWGRAQHMARNGEVDGFFPAFQTPERDKIGVMSVGLTSNVWTWYLLRDNTADPFSEEFRATARVGGIRNGVMAGWIKRNGFNLRGDPLDIKALMDMLIARRLDAVLDTREAAEAIIKQRQLEGRLRAVPLMESPVGVYLSHTLLKKNPGFMERFNAAAVKVLKVRD